MQFSKPHPNNILDYPARRKFPSPWILLPGLLAGTLHKRHYRLCNSVWETLCISSTRKRDASMAGSTYKCFSHFTFPTKCTATGKKRGGCRSPKEQASCRQGWRYSVDHSIVLAKRQKSKYLTIGDAGNGAWVAVDNARNARLASNDILNFSSIFSTFLCWASANKNPGHMDMTGAQEISAICVDTFVDCCHWSLWECSFCSHNFSII